MKRYLTDKQDILLPGLNKSLYCRVQPRRGRFLATQKPLPKLKEKIIFALRKKGGRGEGEGGDSRLTNFKLHSKGPSSGCRGREGRARPRGSRHRFPLIYIDGDAYSCRAAFHGKRRLGTKKEKKKRASSHIPGS